MSPTIYHSLNLLIVVVAVIVGWQKVAQLRRTFATYNDRLLPFAYYSLTAAIFWGLQCLLQIARPILSIPNDLFVEIGLLLGITHNILWFAAVLPLYAKRFSELSRTLPLVIAFSIVIVAISFRTGALSSAAFAWIDGLSGFIIFGSLAYAIVQWKLNKLPAAVFAIHAYFQVAWRSLWIKPFAETSVLTLIAFPLWRFALLYFWIKVISAMVQRQQSSSKQAANRVQQLELQFEQSTQQPRQPVRDQEPSVHQSETPAQQEAHVQQLEQQVQQLKEQVQQLEQQVQELEEFDLLTPFGIMISSTIKGLEQERDAAEKAISGLRHLPLRSENFGSASQPPREICILLAKRCRIFVLIIGQYYGTKIEPEGISVVELEFNTAYKQNPKKILLYVKDGVPYEPEVEAFLSQLQHFNEGFFRSLFKTPEELYELLQRDLTRWITSHVKK
jgi:uncharacterized protein DUF4062